MEAVARKGAGTFLDLLLVQEPALGLGVALMVLVLLISIAANVRLARYIGRMVDRTVELAERGITAYSKGSAVTTDLRDSIEREAVEARARWERIKRIDGRIQGLDKQIRRIEDEVRRVADLLLAVRRNDGGHG